MKNSCILGIESSCDETAAAVVRNHAVLSNVVASQIAIHHPYGGVVPELAARSHLQAIDQVVRQAMDQAGMDFDQIDAIAATRGPGLVGALLVGFSFAKALAWHIGRPFLGVNHLEGHIEALFLEPAVPSFPFVALLVSGGHTALYLVKGHTELSLLGQTRDDAAGEAYDKVAKMLGLGYPGGPVIDRLATGCRKPPVVFPRPLMDSHTLDFSFSGLKTAVLRYLEKNSGRIDDPEHLEQIAAGFQAAVVTILTARLLQAARQTDCGQMAIAGGVAANQELRTSLQKMADQEGLKLYLPGLSLCGDNAAMIAAAGRHYLAQERTGKPDDDVYSRSSQALLL